MFDKQYRFKGSHAVRVTKLTSIFESIKGIPTKVFERNVDVLCNAPLIGFCIIAQQSLITQRIQQQVK